jgi:hypothetical protein
MNEKVKTQPFFARLTDLSIGFEVLDCATNEGSLGTQITSRDIPWCPFFHALIWTEVTIIGAGKSVAVRRHTVQFLMAK